MKKRVKAAAAVLVCALALSLASCKGENGVEQIAELSAPAAEELLAVSAKDLYPLEPGYVLDALALAGDTLAVAAHRGEDWELALFDRPEAETLDELNLGEATLIPLEQLCPGAVSISGFCSDGEGFCLLAEGQPGRRLLRLSEDGRLLSEADCSGLQTGEIGGIALSREGCLAVTGAEFHAPLELYEPETGRSVLLPLEFGEDSVRAVSPSALGLIAGTTISGSYLIDGESMSMSPLPGAPMNVPVTQGLDGAYLCYDLSTYSLWDGESRESRALFEGCPIVSTGPAVPKAVCQTGGRMLLCLEENSDKLTAVGPAREERPVDGGEVRVAIVKDQGGDTPLTFEMSSLVRGLEGKTGYSYAVTEYSYEERDRLLTEIGSGKAPDLLLFTGGFDTASGAFEDLVPWLDGDGELDRTDFLPGLLPALETEGELHELWTAVQISTLGIRERDWDGSLPLTIEACDELMATGRYDSVFNSAMTPENLLAWLARISSGAYVDRRSGKCAFTEEGFGSLLEWGKKAASPQGAADDLTRVLLAFEPMLSNVGRVAVLPEVYGGDLIFTGFPGDSGNRGYFSSGGIRMAIPREAVNKAGAWDFIRRQLTMEAQLPAPGAFTQGFPVRLDALRRACGRELPEKICGRFLELAESITRAVDYTDEQLTEIVTDCGMDYLTGGKPLADTVQAVQSRVSLLIAERFG